MLNFCLKYRISVFNKSILIAYNIKKRKDIIMFDEKKLMACIIAVISIIYTFALTDDFGVGTISEDSNSKTKVVLNEVVHSVFYTPQYVALEKGFFEENGLDVEIIVGNGADKSMTSLLTGEADIILAGPESSMYVQSNENGKEVVNIAQLTKRAGNFLIARDDVESFGWEDVKGKTIIGGRPGGMPQITLEYILKENGVDLKNDVNLITNIDFTATAGAFSSGDYDYTVEFEPNATKLENDGYGTVVASLGVDGGEIPYTSYITTKNFADNNDETIEKFLLAIKEANQFINENSTEDVALAISGQFETFTQDELESIINRYKNQDTWNENLIVDIEAYENLEKILRDAGTLTGDVDINRLIDNSHAENLVGE